jgi:hypothetical protein
VRFRDSHPDISNRRSNRVGLETITVEGHHDPPRTHRGPDFLNAGQPAQGCLDLLRLVRAVELGHGQLERVLQHGLVLPFRVPSVRGGRR